MGYSPEKVKVLLKIRTLCRETLLPAGLCTEPLVKSRLLQVARLLLRKCSDLEVTNLGTKDEVPPWMGQAARNLWHQADPAVEVGEPPVAADPVAVLKPWQVKSKAFDEYMAANRYKYKGKGSYKQIRKKVWDDWTAETPEIVEEYCKHYVNKKLEEPGDLAMMEQQCDKVRENMNKKQNLTRTQLANVGSAFIDAADVASKAKDAKGKNGTTVKGAAMQALIVKVSQFVADSKASKQVVKSANLSRILTTSFLFL
jgi:hypothetical protein